MLLHEKRKKNSSENAPVSRYRHLILGTFPAIPWWPVSPWLPLWVLLLPQVTPPSFSASSPSATTLFFYLLLSESLRPRFLHTQVPQQPGICTDTISPHVSLQCGSLFHQWEEILDSQQVAIGSVEEREPPNHNRPICLSLKLSKIQSL